MSKYWVIGGQYTDTRFERLVLGTEQVAGPFPSRDAALTAWRQLCDASRSDCFARYSIAEEPIHAA